MKLFLPTGGFLKVLEFLAFVVYGTLIPDKPDTLVVLIVNELLSEHLVSESLVLEVDENMCCYAAV